MNEPYTYEQMEKLKEWLNKPYEPGEVHIPDSVVVKIHRLIATVDNLNRFNNLVEKEITRLKRSMKLDSEFPLS